MEEKGQNSGMEQNKGAYNDKKQPAFQQDFSELSGPVLFAKADDILFSAAMEDEIISASDIEIGESILNSGNKAKVSIENTEIVHSEEKPPENKTAEPEIEVPDDNNYKFSKEQEKTEPQAETLQTKKEEVIPLETHGHEADKDMEPENLHIRSIVHEEIFEFDLSDPITEPTTVNEGSEESFFEEISIIQEESEHLNAHGSDAIDISSAAQSMPSLEINLEPPAANKEPAQTETETVEKHVEDKIEIKTLNREPVSETSNKEFPSEPEHVGEESFPFRNESLSDICMTEEDSDYMDETDIEIDRSVSGITNIEKIKEIVLEGKHINIDVDVSREHIILINNSQEFLKYQHTIMDNRCISFFWPCDEKGLTGSRISISTEKEKTFVIDLDKIDITLLSVLIKMQRPVKIFYSAKPVLVWCLKNNLKMNQIFDISTAMNILSDGQTVDNSLKALIKRFAGKDIGEENIDFQDFVLIGKFIFLFRKRLVECIQELNLMKVLNFEQNLLFAIAKSESDGMPYNPECSNPMSQNIWELVESKYGVSSKKELANSGILFLNKNYLAEKKNMLEVYEYSALESAERILKNFDLKFVSEGRIRSRILSGHSGSIIPKDYSFDGEGLYPFISPDKDYCLVEGEFKNLEARVVAKLLNNRNLINSFNTEEGPFSYFAGPLFDKSPDEVTIEEKFKAKMIFEIVIRNLGERETLYYAWNTSKSFLKEEEIISLKEKFKKVHPDLINLIKETQKQVKKDGCICSSTGRITVLNNSGKAFFNKVEMYMNEIFKHALDLSFIDFEAYNAEFSNNVKLCTIYNRIITLECDKKIVNIAIDMLTRNMTKTAAKMLGGIPILLKVHAAEQWEA